MVKKKHPYLLACLRDMRGTMGRFIAILLIVTLGVGFFAGLRVTEPSMTATAQKYLKDNNLYDFRLLSTLGFDASDEEAFDGLEGVTAEGAYRMDLLAGAEDGSVYAVRAHSLTETLNRVVLIEGRLPENNGECLIDRNRASAFPLGTTLTVTAENTQEVRDALSVHEYRVVGYVNSPLYMNFERGTTTLANGTLACFIYLPENVFTSDVYAELYLDAAISAEAYTDGYDTGMDGYRGAVEALLNERAQVRRDKLLSEALAGIADSQAELDGKLAEWETQSAQLSAAEAAGVISAEEAAVTRAALTAAKAQLDAAQAALSAAREEAEGLELPRVFSLERGANVGYAAFESDSQIVSSISVVFPVLFLLVAVLVCMTTMTRMVDENRTQIGTLKSLGYTSAAIHGRFQLYAGSAAFVGWLGGYFLGTVCVPKIIWAVYGIMYGFSDQLLYVFDLPLFLICLAASMGCACGAAYFACRAALREQPAELLRPKAPKAGKKIFLEHIKFFWHRLSFLHKVSARNVFRYKNRLFMMILGIGGCTALLVTGFGINDSIRNIGGYQFGEIMVYDYAATVNPDDAEVYERLRAAEGVESASAAYQSTVSLTDGDATVQLYLLTSERENFTDFVRLHDGDRAVSLPENGEAVLSRGTAERLGVKAGDTVTLRSAGLGEGAYRVADIFDNFIYNYVILSPEDAQALCGESCENTVYLRAADSADSAALTTALGADPAVTNLTVTEDVVARVTGSLNSIKGIVVFVVICAAALAFVVLYNLSNINIAERVREIATIKVLGFRRGEVSAYIFREIFVLTAMGTVIGLPLGRLLHRFVMGQIQVDQVSFENRITPWSYLIAAAMTLLFAVVINLFMSRRLDKIDMSGSLKSVE